jgi:hypothetical protein
MMGRFRTPHLVAAFVVSLGTACGGATATPSPSPSSQPSTGTTSTPATSATTTTSTTISVEPTPAFELPDGLPTSYDHDVPAADVRAVRLVPDDTTLVRTAYAATAAGEAIVVTWTGPGADPFRSPAGWAAWRRFPDPPAWRPVLGGAYEADDGVLGIDSIVADVTGDDSDDALLFAATGGSGACGTYLVADLASALVAFSRTGCDTWVSASGEPAGLQVRESIYKEGDAHCCPSATRIRVLTYAGSPGEWEVASSKVVRN